MIEQQRQLESELETLKRKAANSQIGNLVDAPKDIRGVQVISRKVEGVDPTMLRELAENTGTKIGSGVVVLGLASDGKASLVAFVSPDLQKRLHAGKIIKKVAELVGGSGGRRPDFAQAGGKDSEKLEDALEMCTISWLNSLIRPLQVVGSMKNRTRAAEQTRELRVLVPMVLLVFLFPASSQAENKIQAFVSPAGKVVFTNLVDNTPQPPLPVLAPTTDRLADEVPASLRNLVDTISTNHGVDPALVRAVIKTESNFNRFAVSNKGALGLMQLIPDTGRRYGVRDFFDPEQNVDGGVRYLRFLLEKFNGNLDLSLAAYNAGENLVERLGRIPPIPETTSYVRRVRSMYKQKAAPLVPGAGDCGEKYERT